MASIDKAEIIRFLNRFQTEKPLYSIDMNPTLDPYYYNDAVHDFIQYAYTNKWVQPDYYLITESWSRADDKLSFIEQLERDDCVRLIAWHIRGDRFSSGLLAHAFDKGYIVAILNRMLEANDTSLVLTNSC